MSSVAFSQNKNCTAKYAKSAKEGKKKFPPRLIDTGGFAKKDRITHRIEISSLDEIDEEVERWLKTAYELDA